MSDLQYIVNKEKAVLGALLINNGAIDKVQDFLHSDHFHAQVHGRIYGAIELAIANGELASPVTLKSVFEDDEDLLLVGGSMYLSELTRHAIVTTAIEDFAKEIVEAAETAKE